MNTNHPKPNIVSDAPERKEVIHAEELENGLRVMYRGRSLTSGYSVSAMADLAQELLQAGAAPHHDLVVSGLYYPLRDLAACAGAIHFRQIDHEDKLLCERINEWFQLQSDAYPDQPWHTSTAQLAANLIGSRDMLLFFDNSDAGRQMEQAFRDAFGEDERLSFPCGPHGRRLVRAAG